LLIRQKGHWEALIIEFDNPNYAKVGAKMIDLKENEVDFPDATDKGPDHIYFGDKKLLLGLKRDIG
jgi:hypothetical protein